MRATHLDLGHRAGTTRIWMGAAALKASAPEIAPWLSGRKLFVISSAPVRALHRPALDPMLESAAEVVELEVPDGESAKTLEVVERLAREMVLAGGKRDSRVVTLGGGTVGDVGGFVAGCFLRGVEFAQFPTTMLAQVDAAIGGKTGVNLPEAKNSVGLFVQPQWVVSDAAFLETLPKEEIRQALFEVVKTAILGDADLFALVEEGLPKLLVGDAELLAEAVRRSAAVKARVVAADEREGDLRRLLNLGHTLGHALETVAGHGRLRHGDAVGHGMLFATALATARGLDSVSARRIRGLLARMRLPILGKLSASDLLETMARDKKARESGLFWVIPLDIGEAGIIELAASDVEHELASFLEGSVESGAVPGVR